MFSSTADAEAIYRRPTFRGAARRLRVPDYQHLEALADVGGADAVPDRTEDLRRAIEAPRAHEKGDSRSSASRPTNPLSPPLAKEES